jgi:hypothetical protein
MCHDIASYKYADKYGYTIGDLVLCRLRLAADRPVPGYCVLRSFSELRTIRVSIE